MLAPLAPPSSANGVRQSLTPPTAVCLLGEPVLGSLLAWWLLGEALTWGKALGGMIILAGIYLAATERRGN